MRAPRLPRRHGRGHDRGDPARRPAAAARRARPGVPPALDRVVRRCLEKDPDQRFHSAHDLALALEAVLDRPPARAADAPAARRSTAPTRACAPSPRRTRPASSAARPRCAALWEQAPARAAAGASSALRARARRRSCGPASPRRSPTGWAVIVVHPGARRRSSSSASASRRISRATPRRSGCSCASTTRRSAFALVVSLAARVRRDALVIVDQFEELFTLNPPETQARFAALLGRLAAEADVHVAALDARRLPDALPRARGRSRPVFDGLTPLGAPSGDGAAPRARRARPGGRATASRTGLADEMLAAVRGRAGSAAAARLLRGAPLGRAGPGEAAPHPRGLRGDRGRRGRPGPARRGDAGADRGRAAGPRAGHPPQPGHRRGHARLGRARGAAVGLRRPPGRPRRCWTSWWTRGCSPPTRRGRGTGSGATGSRSSTSRSCEPGPGSSAGRRRTRRGRCCATS